MNNITLFLLVIVAVGCAVQATASTCKDSFPKFFCQKFKDCLMPNARLGCRKTCNACDDDLTPTKSPVSVTTAFPLVTGAPVPKGKCGVPSLVAARVIGGTYAKAGAWPWQIRLMKHRRPSCGGTLISPEWVVTASHCVARDQTASVYSIEVGAVSHSQNEPFRMAYKVDRVIMHPSYDPRRTNNDIALLHISKPVLMNANVQPACLPQQNQELPEGTECFITGFGKTTHPGPMSKDLKQAKLPIVSQRNCQRLNIRTITRSMLCAGSGGSQREGGCHGDSGGPLVCRNAEGAFVLHGAVSWGSGTCESHKAYTVFSKVSQFRNWIDAYLRSS